LQDAKASAAGFDSGFDSGGLRAAALVILALTALRLLALALSPLELDFEEAQYWLWAQIPAWGYFSKPPLIAWLIGAVTSLCGPSEFCIRLPSPILHAITALLLGAAAGRLRGARAAFWVALAWAGLPGVSFSSLLMTTDVPLLLFWALAFYGLLRTIQDGGLRWPVATGLAAGLGFLSKYAMLYFLPCVAIALLWAPDLRRSVGRREIGAFLLGLLLVALPNLAWNLAQGGVTWRHTAQLAKPEGSSINWHALGEYLSGQVGVVGPIFLALLLLLLRRPSWLARPAVDESGGPPMPPAIDQAKLLACLSLPILILLTLVAVFGRGHGNWAVAAYPAAVIALVLGLQGRRAFRWLRWGVLLHLALAVAGAVAVMALALHPDLGGLKALDRLSGWRDLGIQVARPLEAEPGLRLLLRDRAAAQLMAYYAGAAPDRFKVWNPDGTVDSQVELTASLGAADSGPFLLADMRDAPTDILSRFATVKPLGEAKATLVSGTTRKLQLYRVDGFLGYK
jgi:4-amino-4-deoxy-L-arabinose transferase-like glycosyltransferase